MIDLLCLVVVCAALVGAALFLAMYALAPADLI
jgi:hypothetical protein